MALAGESAAGEVAGLKSLPLRPARVHGVREASVSRADPWRVNCDLVPTAILYAMPPLRNERQRLEQERAELPGQIIARRGELAETPADNTARRERLEWQVRRLRMTRAEQAGLRLADVPRPLLAKLRCQHRIDAKVRQGLGLVLRRRRPKGLGMSPKGQPQEGGSSPSGGGRASRLSPGQMSV
jgi:hypothetical protein